MGNWAWELRMGKLAKAKNALTRLSSSLCTAASLTYVELALEYITRGTRFQFLSLTVSFQLGQINVGVEVFRQEQICFCIVHTLQNNVIFVVNGFFNNMDAPPHMYLDGDHLTICLRQI